MRNFFKNNNIFYWLLHHFGFCEMSAAISLRCLQRHHAYLLRQVYISIYQFHRLTCSAPLNFRSHGKERKFPLLDCSAFDVTFQTGKRLLWVEPLTPEIFITLLRDFIFYFFNLHSYIKINYFLIKNYS